MLEKQNLVFQHISDLYCYLLKAPGVYPIHERTYEPIVLRQRKRSRLDIVFLQFKTFGKKRRSINVK